MSSNNSGISLIAKIFTLLTIITGASLIGGLILGIFTLIMWVPLAFWESWAAVKLWDWFLVPAGLPHVSIYAFVGIMLVWATLGFYGSSQNMVKKDENGKVKANSVFSHMLGIYIRPALMLGVGYVIKTWLM